MGEHEPPRRSRTTAAQGFEQLVSIADLRDGAGPPALASLQILEAIVQELGKSAGSQRAVARGHV
jgi:hypothetical protein